jgi:LPXTG-motif cell wall-anchored protein
MMSVARSIRVILLCALAALAWGCQTKSDNTTADSNRQDNRVSRSEVELGPVQVTVEVEPAEARLSDEPTLTLTIRSQDGVDVVKPPFGESLGDFLIRDFREPLPKVEDQWRILQQVYTLEPTRTGELSIWPISVTFTDNRTDGDGRKHTLQTEGLTVTIASVLEDEVPSLDDLKPMADPVELPTTGRTILWLTALILLLAAGGGLFAWRRLRRQAAEAAVPLSPRELAWLEFERLIQRNLAQEDVKLFYVELTGVVRRYIERTTGVRAPEQTTEEFLSQIALGTKFAAEESRRLKDFLESADLVKFAAHQPLAEDIEKAFDRAKLFIGLNSAEVAA